MGKKTMIETTEININDQCEVTLTEIGYKIVRSKCFGPKSHVFSPIPDKFDKDNPPVLKLSFWELMQIFGPAMRMGIEAPFVNNKILITSNHF